MLAQPTIAIWRTCRQKSIPPLYIFNHNENAGHVPQPIRGMWRWPIDKMEIRLLPPHSGAHPLENNDNTWIHIIICLFVCGAIYTGFSSAIWIWRGIGFSFSLLLRAIVDFDMLNGSKTWNKKKKDDDKKTLATHFICMNCAPACFSVALKSRKHLESVSHQ